MMTENWSLVTGYWSLKTLLIEKKEVKMLDFNVVKAQHTLWTMKMNHFVNSKDATTADISLTSYQDCQLGKWLYSEGMSKFGLFPDMRELEKAHQDLHNLGKKIVNLKQQGQVMEARKQLFPLQDISDKVVDLLEKIEKQVKATAR